MGRRQLDPLAGIVCIEHLEPRQLLSFSITGHVFTDLNADGRHERKEPYLAGVQVFLDRNFNGHFDAGEPVATTNKNGSFRINKIGRGSYDLGVISPSGMAASAPATGIWVLPNLRHGTSRNFALHTAPGVGSGPTDTMPPTASLSAPNVTSAGADIYQFSVTYTDDSAVNASSIGGGNIIVTGPNSYSAAAALVSLDAQQNGPSRVATYSITPPGNSWDIADSGIYTIALVANQVRDVTGNAMPGATLGTFSVTLNQAATNAPGGPQLVAASDTGASSSDGVTLLNNALSSAALQFQVSNTIAGATVFLFADERQIASVVANVDTTTLTTDGATLLTDGTHTITARQTESGLAMSPDSAPASIVVDTTAPTPSATLANVNGFGGTSYAFNVTFSDNVAIDTSSLDSNDLLVTGPAGFSQLATFVSANDPSNGTPRSVTYRFTPPGGAWDAADDGTYTIALQSNQVFDTAGNAAAAQTVGSFSVNAAIPVTAAPSAPQLLPASDTGFSNSDGVTLLNNASSAAALSFNVAGTIAGADVTLYADGTAIGSAVAAETITTVTTNGNMPLADGPHTITARQTLSGFAQSTDSDSATVRVDSAPPTGSATFAPITSAAAAGYDFSVTYSDNLAIDASTLDGSDILVTGPNGFSQAATLVAVDARANASPRTASYHISAPGGKWDTSDNGNYAVTLQGGQVFDTAGNAAAQAVLGTIAVNIAASTSQAPAAPILWSTSDTGSSNSDGITNLSNSSQSNALLFSVSNIVPGDVVTLYADGTAVGSAVATGSSTIVGTRGDLTFSDGTHHFTARQKAPNVPQSGDSPATSVVIDTVPPAASLKAKNITTPGNTDYFFTVTYTDAGGVDVSTLHDSNLLVTNANGYSQTATLVGVDHPASGSPRTATYEVRPPADEWSVSDNAVYTITLQDNQVADLAGNVMAGATLGTFTVAIPPPAPAAVYLASNNQGTPSHPVTTLNNSTASTRLQFTITGCEPGATISLYSDGTLIGSGTSTSDNMLLYTDGVTPLSLAQHKITARQTVAGSPQSSDSAALMLTVKGN